LFKSWFDRATIGKTIFTCVHKAKIFSKSKEQLGQKSSNSHESFLTSYKIEFIYKIMALQGSVRATVGETILYVFI
jgi:hypothetical protein